jgi:membrane-associated phospholipid phosphatase
MTVNKINHSQLNKLFTSIYFWCIILFWCVGFILIFATNQFELHKTLNTFHNSFFDTIVPYATHIGDGLFAILLVGVLYFFQKKKSLTLLVSFAISSLLVQFLKQVVFTDALRPFYYFRTYESFHFVKGVIMHTQNSFPSGHSTTCFAVFTSLAIFYEKNQKVQFFLSSCAILVSLTRVYLSQHFLEDVLAGSFIGAIVALLVGYYIPKISFLKKLE